MKEEDKILDGCGVRIADPEEYTEMEMGVETQKQYAGKGEQQIHVIPLAFHIIHKGEEIGTGTNISDYQVYSAVNGLNEDFSKELNSTGDGTGVTTPFRFELINKDDQGNPTTGIYRVNGDARSSVYAADGIRNGSKGLSELTVKNWSRQDNQWAYNIWVVSEIGGNNGGSGVQGFAYFPTKNLVDGIVQLYNATGKRPPGWTYSSPEKYVLKSYTSWNKTITHEMGHAFALFHTFQGNSCEETNCTMQGDRVCDTPPTIRNSNGNYPACGGTQQVNNYMDYTNQAFKNMFTQGQNDRMISAVEFSRANLISSGALDNLTTIQADATIEIVGPDRITCPGTEQYLSVLITNTTNNVIHEMDLEYTLDGVSHTYKWYGPIGAYSTDTISLVKVPTLKDTVLTASIKKINNLVATGFDTKTMIIPTNDPYKIEILRDVISGQISWDVVDADNLEVLYKSPVYANFKARTIDKHNICLPDGNFIFTLIDVVDGMETPDAYIKLMAPNGEVLVNATNGFNSPLQYSFTIGEEPIPVPVFEFYDFETTCFDKNKNLELRFKTKNDEDIKYYNLYRASSSSLKNLKYVSKVNSKKTTETENAYKIIDPNYKVNPTYYVLKAVLADNSEILLDDLKVDCVPINEFELLKFEYVCEKGGPVIMFHTRNDQEVHHYNIYKIDIHNNDKFILIDTVEVNNRSSKGSNVNSMNVENGYKIYDETYFESPTYYVLSTEINGKENHVAKLEVMCKVENKNHWYIRDGRVYSNKYKFEEIRIYSYKGKEFKNEKLRPGKYIAVFGDQEKEEIVIERY